MADDIYAFEEGPTITEEGQFYDPEFVVYEENTTVDVTERLDLAQLVVNPEVLPVVNDSFTVKPSDIDQDFILTDSEATIY